MAEGDDEVGALSSLDPVVREARKRFNRCAEFEAVWRQKFVSDVKFANGDSHNGYQWPNEIRNLRERSARPCLTMNLIKPHNRMISNEARKNKSSVRYVGMGNGATQEMADVYQDLHRWIEYQSGAQAAYTKAREFQIDGGIGYWRLLTKYASPESFELDISIDPVNDPLMVYMDPDIQRTDGLDAAFAFLFDDIDKEEFEDAYPELKDLIGHQPLGMGSVGDDWVAKNKIRVVEYFRKVPVKRKLLSFVHRGERHTISEEKLMKLVRDREARDRVIGDPTTRIREVLDAKVEWFLIAGERRIDETEWPGRYVPIVRCVGEELVIDGQVDRKGHTRQMLDAQRMFNYNAALDVNTRVPTPSGWTTMGRLQEGDLVFGQDGLAVPVAKALPVKVGEPCYRITFDNGHSIVTDAGHVWTVEERGKRTSRGETWNRVMRATAELRKGIHFIWTAEPLRCDEVDVPLDPYLLGVWLGDGHKHAARISSHVEDFAEMRGLLADLGYTVGEAHDFVGNGCSFNVFGIRAVLREMGLSEEKFIPKDYLRGSSRQRLALLQGLMDTDGHFAQKVNQCVFVNTNANIVSGVLELCASLGIKATVDRTPQHMHEANAKGKVYISATAFRVQFTADPSLPVFRLGRKARLQTADRPVHPRRTKRIGIVSIVPVASVPVRCITLDTPEHLYLVGEGMIPTHNSAQVEFGALQTKAPWLAPAKAIEEYEAVWRTLNIDNPAVVPYNHIDPENPEQPIPPPIRIDPPNISPAFQQGMENARQQIMMVTGQYENTQGEQGNERTGAAINARRAQGATATYHFQDNYELALIATGKMILDLVPRVMDTKRVMQIQADDGLDYEVVMDPGARQGYLEERAHDGRVVRKALNPLVGRFDVAASVGPAYEVKRDEVVDQMTLVLTQAPQLIGLLGDILVKNMGFDGAQEAAQRLRRMVPPQALGSGPSQELQAAQQQIAALTQALAKSLDKEAKSQLKLAGKDQLRDIEAYNAETKRMATLKEQLAIDPEGLRQIVEQLVAEASGTQVGQIHEENAETRDNTEAAGEAEGSADRPPMAGAKRAPDGQWYVEHSPGQFARVSPKDEGAPANG